MAKARTNPPAIAPAQPCGCPAVIDGLKGAHLPDCPFTAASKKSGVTLERWAKEQGIATHPLPGPLARCVTLAPDDAPISAFHHWCSHDQIPPRSVLAQFVGTGMNPAVSGYIVAAVSATGQTNHTELGTPGDRVPARLLEGYTIRAEVRHGRHLYVILSPLESDS